MERFKIDADLPAKLKDLTRPVELVNDDGFVVAVVQPHYDPALTGPGLSPEEIERRCQPGRKTYTAEEVIALLRKIP